MGGLLRAVAVGLVAVAGTVVACGTDDESASSKATPVRESLADLGLVEPEVTGVQLAGRTQAEGHAGEPSTGTVDYLVFRTLRSEGEAIEALSAYFTSQGFRMREDRVRWHVRSGVRGDERYATNIAIGPLDAFLASREWVTAGVDEPELTKHRDDGLLLVVRIQSES